MNWGNQAIEYTLNASNKPTCIGGPIEHLSDGTNKAVDDGSEVSNNGIDGILKAASNTSLKSWFLQFLEFWPYRLSNKSI